MGDDENNVTAEGLGLKPDRSLIQGDGKGEMAIRATDLGKWYRRVSAGYQLRTLKSALLSGSLTAGLKEDEAIRALEGVSFEVARGEAFGVVGGNGSGKSTLLKVVSGLLKPTSGTLDVRGKVAALIELGAGFHPEISGRENVFINGAVMGLTRRQIEERYDQIVEFSGLGDFLEEPVKNYSSGMYVRLGFSVAIHTDPDVLLVDEVLAVGDEAFGRKCLRRIEEHLADGGTLLVVSHSLDLVESLCDRVLWLQNGVQREIGEPRRVIDAYRQEVAQEEGRQHAAELSAGQGDGDETDRWGSGVAKIKSARCMVASAVASSAARQAAAEETEQYQFHSGDSVAFEFEVETREELKDFVFGIGISTPRGVECWGTNTDLAGFVPERFEGSSRIRVLCPQLRLAPGEYAVDLAVHSKDGTPYDYRKKCFHITVVSDEKGVGLYFPEHQWSAGEDVVWSRSSAQGDSSDPES